VYWGPTMAKRAWGLARVQLLLLLGLGSAVDLVLSVSGRLPGPSLLSAFFAGRFPWLSVCLGATFFVHVITLGGASRKNLIVVGGLSELPHAFPGLFPDWKLPVGLGLAISAVIYRAVLAFRAPPAERAEHFRASFDALVPPWFCLICTQPLAFGASITPLVRDPEIQAIGGVLGAYPPLLVARLFASSALLKGVCTLVYSMMPLGLSVVHAFALRADPERRPSLLLAFLLIPFLGYPLYFALPMVGPREAWASLSPHVPFPPASVPHFTSTLLSPSITAPRNCMPSLHTAWTLAALLEARRVSRGVCVFAAFWFGCTELATLGLGEHWLIDLVVAIPFTLVVYAVALGSLRNPRSFLPLAVLSSLVVGWIGSLAVFTAALQAQPLAVDAAMLLTLLISGLFAPRVLDECRSPPAALGRSPGPLPKSVAVVARRSIQPRRPGVVSWRSGGRSSPKRSIKR